MAPHSPPVTVLRTPTGVAVQALAFLPRPASDAGAVLATADADGTLRVWHVGHTAMLDVVEHAVSDAAIGVTALPPGPLPAGGGADGGDGSGGGGGGDDKDGGEYGGAAPVTGGRLVGRPLATLVVQDKTGMVVRVAVTTTHAGSDDDSDGEGDDTDSAATSSDTNDGDDAEVTLRLSRPSRLGVTPPPSAGFTPAWWPTLPTGGVGGGMGRGVVTPTPTPDGGCGLSIGGVPAPVAHTPPRGMVTALADGCAGFEDGTVVLLPPGGGGVVDVGVPAALPSGDGGDSGGGGDGGGDGDGGRAPLLDGPVLALAPCRGWLAAAGATSTLAVVPAVAGGGARGARVRTRSTGVGGLAWGRGGMLAAACWDGKVRLYQVRRRPGGGERGGVSLCQLASLVHHNGRYVAGGRGGGGLHRGGGRGERGWGELAGAAWCGMALPPPPLLCAAWEGFGWHRGRRRGCGGPSAPPAAPGRHWLAGMRCCARGARLRRRHERNECGSGGGASFFLCLVLQPPATGGGGGGCASHFQYSSPHSRSSPAACPLTSLLAVGPHPYHAVRSPTPSHPPPAAFTPSRGHPAAAFSPRQAPTAPWPSGGPTARLPQRAPRLGDGSSGGHLAVAPGVRCRPPPHRAPRRAPHHASASSPVLGAPTLLAEPAVASRADPPSDALEVVLGGAVAAAATTAASAFAFPPRSPRGWLLVASLAIAHPVLDRRAVDGLDKGGQHIPIQPVWRVREGGGGESTTAVAAAAVAAVAAGIPPVAVTAVTAVSSGAAAAAAKSTACAIAAVTSIVRRCLAAVPAVPVAAATPAVGAAGAGGRGGGGRRRPRRRHQCGR